MTSSHAAALSPSSHVDGFARDHLPPLDEWPEFLFELPALHYPQRINCAAELVDAALARGWGGRTAQLERHPDGLRMGELSRRMMVTGGNVTGITDQLEREGLVARVPDPQDKRAFAVKLTPAGQEAFAAMAKVHEGWVEELLGHVAAEDKEHLIGLLSGMKAGLDGRSGG